MNNPSSAQNQSNQPNSTIGSFGFYQFVLLICFILFSFSLTAQNDKNTIVSVGYSYLTNPNSFWLGANGVEVSAEFLMNDEKIGLKLPLQLHFVGDLYLGMGANLKFYTNKGKLRGFVGPNFAIGRNLHRNWADDFVEKEKPYMYLLGDTGIAYNHNNWVMAIHAGVGFEFSYKDAISNLGLTLGRKF